MEVEVVRVKITLACTECKQRNYNMTKDKKTHPDRMETKKYCRFCKSEKGSGCMENKKKDADSKSGKDSWFKNMKAEFKKIVWPDRKSLIRQSVAVIASAVGLGFIIALLDMIIRFGFGFIIK